MLKNNFSDDVLIHKISYKAYLRATMTSYTLHLGTFFFQRVRERESVVGRLLGKPVAFGGVSEKIVVLVLLRTPKSGNMVYESCDDVTMC